MHAPLARPVRHFGVVNWQGLWTLYLREVRRFLKVSMQTLFAPVVTTLIFLMIFLLAMNGQSRVVGNVPFLQFLAPGLVMMSITQNAFANTTSSIMIMKMQGNIVDLLMPPINAWELTWGFALGGLTRGMMVGAVVTAAMAIFVHVEIASIWAALFFAAAASLLLSVLGIIGAIWADKYDHLAAVTNFIITPLSFLSGTFYSIEQLPPTWHTVALCNPFFYMIDGFRYGLTGQTEAPLWAGVLFLTAINVALLYLAYLMIDRGYKLKA
jgi:ABC-2 type transport system permease protein